MNGVVREVPNTLCGAVACLIGGHANILSAWLFSEVTMRNWLFAAVLAISPTLALADQSISGQWQAKPGHGVIIVMDILVDGHWFSQTVQDNKVVAEMAGTYDQTRTTDTAGKLVFKPVTSKTSAEHGAAQVEEDEYTLTKGGKVLRLVTAGEVTDFKKQPLATK